jgi:hypothetical protein
MREYVRTSDSSNIESVAYDKDDSMLLVRFQTGSEYAYYNVPEDKYQNLLEAESKGKFFVKEIKPEYEYKKI